MAENRDEDDDKTRVLCLALETSPVPYVPNAMIRKCGTCGREVWLSPATAKALAGVDHELCCERCIPPLEKGDVIQPPTEAQFAEMPADVVDKVRKGTATPKARARMLREVLRRARKPGS